MEEVVSEVGREGGKQQSSERGKLERLKRAKGIKGVRERERAKNNRRVEEVKGDFMVRAKRGEESKVTPSSSKRSFNGPACSCTKPGSS